MQTIEPTAAAATDSILTRLKARTAHQHQQTEDGVDLMRDDFSLEEYRNLLVRFYAFYKPFEAKMRRAIERFPINLDYAERANAPKLLADLKKLGMPDAEINRIETFGDVPALDSAEKLFGALYVVEGSTLGGQIIARHLKEKFDLGETSGVAFFNGYGKNTGKMWNAFRAAITEYATAADADDEEIIESANRTFEQIGACLAEKDSTI